jgi:hypothetical protein
MKQEKAILHNRFNGENTPVEELDDSLGDMLASELIFPYAARQFNPRNTNDMGERFDPRRAYAKKGGTS